MINAAQPPAGDDISLDMERAVNWRANGEGGERDHGRLLERAVAGRVLSAQLDAVRPVHWVCVHSLTPYSAAGGLVGPRVRRLIKLGDNCLDSSLSSGRLISSYRSRFLILGHLPI